MTELYDISRQKLHRTTDRSNAVRAARKSYEQGWGYCFLMRENGRLLLGTPSYKGKRYIFDWREVSEEEAARIINKDKISSTSPEPAQRERSARSGRNSDGRHGPE